jgi:hypothetical protein
LLLHFIYRLLSGIASTVCHGLGGRDRKWRYKFVVGGGYDRKNLSGRKTALEKSANFTKLRCHDNRPEQHTNGTPSPVVVTETEVMAFLVVDNEEC